MWVSGLTFAEYQAEFHMQSAQLIKPGAIPPTKFTVRLLFPCNAAPPVVEDTAKNPGKRVASKEFQDAVSRHVSENGAESTTSVSKSRRLGDNA